MSISDYADSDDVPRMVRTLVANRFHLDSIHRTPNYLRVDCHRYDEFGGKQSYSFALCASQLNNIDSEALKQHSKYVKSCPVVIGGCKLEDITSISWAKFLACFGGAVGSLLPIEPVFRPRLIDLGHNRPLTDVVGRPDDLFEEYVHLALQFILSDRVIRYGQDRRGEAVPDGLAFAKESLVLLYDAKAYANGYPVTRDSIRQFSDYVNSFHRSYERILGRVFAFLVISGEFVGRPSTLENHSKALYAECGVPMCFLTADVLGSATEMFACHPTARHSVDWKSVFARTVISSNDIKRSIEAVLKDGIVR